MCPLQTNKQSTNIVRTFPPFGSDGSGPISTSDLNGPESGQYSAQTKSYGDEALAGATMICLLMSPVNEGKGRREGEWVKM